jgi:uroporphyrinogen-III decarboxylase
MHLIELMGFISNEDVISHATECIWVGKPGGGYVLSTACSVAPRTELWKLELLVPLAEDMGIY